MALFSTTDLLIANTIDETEKNIIKNARRLASETVLTLDTKDGKSNHIFLDSLLWHPEIEKED